MSGYLLGQEYGHGHTFEYIAVAGVSTDAAAPVAGENYTYTVTRYDRMRLVAATFTLTTDATAGNRYVTLEYPGVNGKSFTADGASVLVTPSTTAQRFLGQFRRGPAEWNTGTDVWFPLSGLWLEQGRSIVITIAGIGATDTLANVQLVFDATPVRDDGSEATRALVDVQRAEAEAAAFTAQFGSS